MVRSDLESKGEIFPGPGLSHIQLAWTVGSTPFKHSLPWETSGDRWLWFIAGFTTCFWIPCSAIKLSQTSLIMIPHTKDGYNADRHSRDKGILQIKKKKCNLIISFTSYFNLLTAKQCSWTKTLHSVTTRKEQYYFQTEVHRLANASSQKLHRLT